MPPLVPASKSPLLAPSLPLTPLPAMKTPLLSAPIASAKPSLDAMFEYMDGDGVMRRSETITNRMVLRGYSIDKMAVVSDSDQAHRSLATREKEERKRMQDVEEAMQEAERKHKANADFKRQCKQERRQWIEEGDELVGTRLQLWYEQGLGAAPEDDIVELTKANTAVSPSKKAQAFVDEDGNMRRKSTVKSTVSETSSSITDSGYKKEDSASQYDSVDAVRPADVTVGIPLTSPVKIR